MAHVNIYITLEWKPIGHITLDDDGKLAFPRAPIRAGIYRFEFKRQQEQVIYVGETVQLARRFQHYRTPGPSQRTNIRLSKRMREALTDGGTLSVAILTDEATISLAGAARQADFSRKSERALLEHAASYEVIESGISVLNA